MRTSWRLSAKWTVSGDALEGRRGGEGGEGVKHAELPTSTQQKSMTENVSLVKTGIRIISTVSCLFKDRYKLCHIIR